MPIEARKPRPWPGMSDSRSGRRSAFGFSSNWTILPCRLTFRMPKPVACSAVTGSTATVASATWRRCVSAIFRKSIW